MVTEKQSKPSETASRSRTLSDWDRLSKIFTNWSSIRPHSSWFSTGMSSRMGPTRVQNLLKCKRAIALNAIVKSNTADDVSRLLSIARINLDQAQAAFRVVILTNITIVVGFVLLTNQLFPGWVAGLLTSDDPSIQIATFSMAAAFPIVSAIIATYSWGGVASARDLAHLLELRLSGMEDGRLDTRSRCALTDSRTGDMISDLRSTQLSDL